MHFIETFHIKESRQGPRQRHPATEEAEIMRIFKAFDLDGKFVDPIVQAVWRSLKGPRSQGQIMCSVRGNRVAMDRLQHYVEGPVFQLTGPTDGNPAGTYALLMHPMQTPRLSPDPNEGQIVDSGMHVHFAARSLVMFAASNSFIAIPTFERPTFEGMSEGTDYIVRETKFRLNDGSNPAGFETLLFPGIIHAEFPAGFAHSFNGYGKECAIISHHPDEEFEMAKQEEFTEIGDGSEFIADPLPIADEDLEFYSKIHKKFL